MAASLEAVPSLATHITASYNM